MATLAALIAPPAYLSLRPKKATQSPPIKAASQDEADFIKCAGAPLNPLPRSR